MVWVMLDSGLDVESEAFAAFDDHGGAHGHGRFAACFPVAAFDFDESVAALSRQGGDHAGFAADEVFVVAAALVAGAADKPCFHEAAHGEEAGDGDDGEEGCLGTDVSGPACAGGEGGGDGSDTEENDQDAGRKKFGDDEQDSCEEPEGLGVGWHRRVGKRWNA